MKHKVFYFIFVLFFAFSFYSFGQSYYMVKDISQGDASSFDWADAYLVPQFLGEFQHRAVVVAHNEANNMTQIWASDGTDTGTVMLHELGPYFIPVFSNFLFVPEKNLAFFDYFGPDTNTIWQYDGAEFKLLVKAEYTSQEMVYFNDKLFYHGAAGSFDDCLYTPGANPTMPQCVFGLEDPTMNGVTVLGNKMIGFGQKQFGTPQLFRSNGTTAGTQYFFDLKDDANSNWSPTWIEGNGKVFFFYQPGGSASMGLYVTDGSAAGTSYLADLWNQGLYPKKSRSQIFSNGKLYTQGEDMAGSLGAELYISDGTPAGTVLLKDINPSGPSAPNFFVAYNGQVYFIATDGSGRKRLWQSDGTASGTVAALPGIFGSATASCDWLTVYDGKLAFVGRNPAEGTEIWLSDGTEAGTYPITNESAAGQNGFTPEELLAVGNNLFFSRYTSQSGVELWVYHNGKPNPALSAEAAAVGCDDNGTDVNLADDFITFDLNVSATALSDSFVISAGAGITVIPNKGAYGQLLNCRLPNGSAGGGNVQVKITDSNQADWFTNLNLTDPGACSMVGTSNVVSSGQPLSVSPNPFAGEVNFTLLDESLRNKVEVQLFDPLGQWQVTIPFEGASTHVSVLPGPAKGIFFYRLRSRNDGKVVYTGKLTAY